MQPRQPAGIPTGGQFAPTSRPETDLALHYLERTFGGSGQNRVEAATREVEKTVATTAQSILDDVRSTILVRYPDATHVLTRTEVDPRTHERVVFVDQIRGRSGLLATGADWGFHGLGTPITELDDDLTWVAVTTTDFGDCQDGTYRLNLVGDHATFENLTTGETVSTAPWRGQLTPSEELSPHRTKYIVDQAFNELLRAAETLREKVFATVPERVKGEFPTATNVVVEGFINEETLEPSFRVVEVQDHTGTVAAVGQARVTAGCSLASAGALERVNESKRWRADMTTAAKASRILDGHHLFSEHRTFNIDLQTRTFRSEGPGW